YFAPTYRDIRDTFWPTIEEAAELLGFRIKLRKADREVDLYRGRSWYGKIICRSMDEPGSIVGFKIARGLVDEIDIMARDKARAAWRKIIARLRLQVAGVVNGIGVTTTPEGFRFVYETFARTPETEGERQRRKLYSMVQASTHENAKYLPPDYIATLQADYPAELIDAYLLGKFVNLTAGTVYRSYDRVKNRSAVQIEPDDHLHIGQDFNVGNMASAVHVERDDGWHAVDELTGLMDTPDLIDRLGKRFPEHKITIYPDASGGSRKSVNASLSDIKLLKQAGHTVKARATNPAVKDRVLAVNSAYSGRKLWVNDRGCPRLSEALEQQAYDKNGEPDKSGGFDHINDAAGYFTHWTMPVVKPKAQNRELRT
ncbi:MAG: terminase family protein, partial [Pseudomonadota bacterium]